MNRIYPVIPKKPEVGADGEKDSKEETWEVLRAEVLGVIRKLMDDDCLNAKTIRGLPVVKGYLDNLTKSEYMTGYEKVDPPEAPSRKGPSVLSICFYYGRETKEERQEDGTWKRVIDIGAACKEDAERMADHFANDLGWGSITFQMKTKRGVLSLLLELNDLIIKGGRKFDGVVLCFSGHGDTHTWVEEATVAEKVIKTQRSGTVLATDDDKLFSLERDIFPALSSEYWTGKWKLCIVDACRGHISTSSDAVLTGGGISGGDREPRYVSRALDFQVAFAVVEGRTAMTGGTHAGSRWTSALIEALKSNVKKVRDGELPFFTTNWWLTDANRIYSNTEGRVECAEVRSTLRYAIVIHPKMGETAADGGDEGGEGGGGGSA